MDLRQLARCILVLVAALAIQYATADEDIQMPIDIYRVKYDGTSAMAKHVAYLSLMQTMREVQQREGAAANIAHIQAHLSLDEAQANRFLQFVLGSWGEMVATNREITQRMLCADKGPKYAAGQAYAVLDVLDDIKETNLRKFYGRALVEFGSDIGEEVEAWIGEIRLGRSEHRYDRTTWFDYDNVSVEDVVSTACNALAMN